MMTQRIIPQSVQHAYRLLYRHGLQAIQYSTPARYLLVRTLRASFRSPDEQFEPQRIANTLAFLQRASMVTGFEHKIVRNLLLTRFWEQPQFHSSKK